MATLNDTFTTGNSTIAGLPVGSILEVVGPGELEITSVPAKKFSAGDRIETKYGNSTVVAASSRFNYIDGFDPETQVLYVADGTFIVRATAKSNVQ